MKATGQCPKCQSYKIINVKGSKMHQSTQIVLNKWSTKMVAVDQYVCTECGFNERYVNLDEKSKRHLEGLLKDQGGGFDEYV